MMTFVVVIDNYDSFTYNIVQYLGELGAKIKVFRNDKVDLNGIKQLKPDRIIISPGPGKPSESGISKEVIVTLGQKVPILGVCLGHQCIGEIFGGKVDKANFLMHGKTSIIFHDGEKIYRGVKNPFIGARYHSLVIYRENFPKELKITSHTDDGTIMGVRHNYFPIEGIQFHPESFMTEEGKKILSNFLYG